MPAIPVLLGTSRGDGNTRALIAAAFRADEVEVIDLAALNLSPFDYAHNNADDGFLPLIEEIVARPVWALASPVYWYAMSAQMKIFIDRLSDLTTIRKDLGRALAGRHVFGFSTSGRVRPPACFEPPLAETCGYFGMHWRGLFHGQLHAKGVVDARVRAAARNFAAAAASLARDG